MIISDAIPSRQTSALVVEVAKSESVDLIIDGQTVGRIAVADLLPRRS